MSIVWKWRQFFVAIQVTVGRIAVRNKDARTLNSWQWRIVSLISATVSSLFILSIYIFFTVDFSIFFLWYANIVTVYYYLCILYLPSPLTCVTPIGLSERVSVNACHWDLSTILPFSFTFSAIGCVSATRIKDDVLHDMKYNPVRWWNS